MKKIAILILLILPFFAYTQNWNLFNLNQDSYYAQTTSNNIRVENLCADSIKSGETQTIYFNRKIGLSNECFDNVIQEAYLVTEWHNLNLIDSLVKQGDSVLYISDYCPTSIDTFLFLPKSNVGDSWQTTKNNIIITCIDKKEEFILGIKDSVKIFSISTEPYNNIQFKLSKNFGLVEFLPLKEFIYHNQDYDLEVLFKLIGYKKNNQEKGYTQPKLKDYFHLHQGDKLFWREYSNPDDPEYPETTVYQVDSIISSYISNDSVNYQYQMKRYDKYGNLINTKNSSYVYTNYSQGKILKTPTSWFNIMPSNYIGTDVYFTGSLNLSIENNDTISHFGYSAWGLILDTLDCSVVTIPDYQRYARFSTREGLVYTASFSWGENSKTLIGSIIDGNIHGTTNLPTDIEFIEENSLRVYPNPTNGKIFIKTQEKIYKITVLDITGKIIIETKKPEIDLANQKKGIYLMKIETDKGILTEKIIY